MKRIGVLTSGGDCPGLNAVLRGIVRTSTTLGWETVGFRDGFEGLLPPGDAMVLTNLNTAGIMPLGGTILGTTNKGHFIAKVGEGNRHRLDEAIIEATRATLAQMRIDALVCIGGDGSLSTAFQLHEAGIPVIGVPKTIDNDLEATATTFGFDSAIAFVTDALDRLHTTAASHKRAMVIEVMGRHAGWIALYGGLAGGADMILIPEIPFDHVLVAEAVRQRDADGFSSTLIVVAEGARTRDGIQSLQATASGEYHFGGMGEVVAAELIRRTGKETRTCVLGHLQRGGAPTTLDRILGMRFGVHAVKMITDARFGRMVSYHHDSISDVPLADAVDRLRLVPVDGEIVQTARSVGISFGDR
jgi:6-phosphofructokinase 1